jgi:hypothetical protein
MWIRGRLTIEFCFLDGWFGLGRKRTSGTQRAQKLRKRRKRREKGKIGREKVNGEMIAVSEKLKNKTTPHQ